jgi:hypothetical protein
MMPRRHQGLLRRPEPRADEHAVGTEDQRRCQCPAVTDATCCQQQRVRRVPGDAVGRVVLTPILMGQLLLQPS